MLGEMTDTIRKRFLKLVTDPALVRAEREQERQARQPLVDELGQLRHQLAGLDSKYDATINAARTDEATKAKAHALATEKRVAAEAEKGSEKHQLTVRIGRLELGLRAGADARIGHAEHAMNQRFDQERHGLTVVVERPTGLFNAMTMQPVVQQLTNEGRVRHLHAALRTARARFDQLRLENPADLDAAIAKVLEPVEAAWAACRRVDDDGPAAA